MFSQFLTQHLKNILILGLTDVHDISCFSLLLMLIQKGIMRMNVIKSSLLRFIRIGMIVMLLYICLFRSGVMLHRSLMSIPIWMLMYTSLKPYGICLRVVFY